LRAPSKRRLPLQARRLRCNPTRLPIMLPVTPEPGLSRQRISS
jgi:hypothetical protein